MKFDIQNNSHANITFNSNAVRVSIRGEHTYTVKWFCDGNFIGDMVLGGGNWGTYPLSIGNWKIEFWQDNNLIGIYDNNLESTDILIIANFNQSTPGKNFNIDSLITRANEIKDKYKCNVVYYFKNSERFNLGDISTLKMNDEYKFELIVEETYG